MPDPIKKPLPTKDTISYANFLQLISLNCGNINPKNIEGIGTLKSYTRIPTLDKKIIVRQVDTNNDYQMRYDPYFVYPVVWDAVSVVASGTGEILENTPKSIISPIPKLGKSIFDISEATKGLKGMGTFMGYVSGILILNQMYENTKNPKYLHCFLGIDINVTTDIVFFSLGFIPFVGWVITGAYIVTKQHIAEKHNQQVGDFIKDKVYEKVLPPYAKMYNGFMFWVSQITGLPYTP